MVPGSMPTRNHMIDLQPNLVVYQLSGVLIEQVLSMIFVFVGALRFITLTTVLGKPPDLYSASASADHATPRLLILTHFELMPIDGDGCIHWHRSKALSFLPRRESSTNTTSIEPCRGQYHPTHSIYPITPCHFGQVPQLPSLGSLVIAPCHLLRVYVSHRSSSGR
jgi:hypothetical protein